MTGELPLHRELAAKFLSDLRELCNLPGLGPKRVRLLIDLLHPHGRDDLERAVPPASCARFADLAPKARRAFSRVWPRPERGSGSCCRRRPGSQRS
jgi:hypothetical protein